MRTLKKVSGSNGNSIIFYRTSLMNKDQICVRDNDCQLERVYTVGATQELDDFEEVKIESIEQVINAWESGTVWF